MTIAMRAKMRIEKVDAQFEGQETLYFRAVSRSDLPAGPTHIGVV
jgi:hypothetical protein